ncbi:3297_t:CDS:2, partial [Funneliformis geosporum]
QKSQEILTTANFTAEEQQKVRGGVITEDNAPQILGFDNPFNNLPTSQKAEQFSQSVQEQVVAKQLAEQMAQQKELEIQQQTETLQKAAEIEQKLKEAQTSLGEPRITWNKIKQTYPEFANQSMLLGELEKADRLLEKEPKSDQILTKRLAKLPVLSEAETNLLSGLNLTIEQYIAISLKTPYLNEAEKEKEQFVELILTLSEEKQLFGLSVKEKENILKFIHSTINLTEEQKAALEEMGIKPYNASE